MIISFAEDIACFALNALSLSFEQMFSQTNGALGPSQPRALLKLKNVVELGSKDLLGGSSTLPLR